jgi:hypothetical protein
MGEAAFMSKMRGLAAPERAPLRAGDLRPGNVYLSPSGRKCLLLQPTESGLSRTSYLFAYIARNGKAAEDDGFSLSASNAHAIAALKEWKP